MKRWFLKEHGSDPCNYCGSTTSKMKILGAESKMQVDKIFPQRGYVEGNMQMLCALCNNRKNDMTSAEMAWLLACQLDAEAEALKLLKSLATLTSA